MEITIAKIQTETAKDDFLAYAGITFDNCFCVVVTPHHWAERLRVVHAHQENAAWRTATIGVSGNRRNEE
jgi:DNA-binding cell septation regulator SpoVG